MVARPVPLTISKDQKIDWFAGNGFIFTNNYGDKYNKLNLIQLGGANLSVEGAIDQIFETYQELGEKTYFIR